MRRVGFSLLGLGLACLGVGAPVFSHPDRVRYDGHCLTIEGKDTFLYSGSFHYFRCPKELWRERFRMIKAAGFNAVETYVAWNWSERQKPKDLNDFSHVNLSDLDEWLTMAEKEFGLYTIVRPGPYICAEWATGGFPNWLPSFRPAQTKRPTWFRSDDPVFEAWSRHWYKAVAQVVGKHQLTHKKPGEHGVILWQVENEYGGNDEMRRNYTRELIRYSQEFGIDIPYFSCWTEPVRHAEGDPLLSQAWDSPNQYPRWNIEDVVGALRDQYEAQPWAPKSVTELQGGWFGNVGGELAEEQSGIGANQISSLTLLAIQSGLTYSNYYMLFGGTNFGDWNGEGITTSYDYFAPIREWGGGGEKYRAVQAIGRMLEKYGPDLARSTEIPAPFESDQSAVRVGARKGAGGATYLFVRNTSRTDGAKGSLGGVIPYDLGPFATNVYRYEASPSAGAWVVNPAPPIAELLPQPVRLTQASVAQVTPTGWSKVAGQATTLDLGVWDSRFVFYRTVVPSGDNRYLWLRSSGGELYGHIAGTPVTSQGGLAWPTSGGTTEFVLLNPGWPNGGSGMEAPHGISNALVTPGLPQGSVVREWKVKRLADPDDRSLVGPGVDTAGWESPPRPSAFPTHTSYVYRGSVDLDSDPAPNTILNVDGVDDMGYFYVNGQKVGEIPQYGLPGQFTVGAQLHKGHNDIAIVIHNNEGDGGLIGTVSVETPLPPSQPFEMDWTDQYKLGSFTAYALDGSAELSRAAHPKIEGDRPASGPLLVRSRVEFDRPENGKAWQIVLDAGGDGFLTLNGHPLGRYWEVGPQRGFYLPSCWLKERNTLELTAVPGRLGDRIKAAELRPLPMGG